jgi:hypothetical protein
MSKALLRLFFGALDIGNLARVDAVRLNSVRKEAGRTHPDFLETVARGPFSFRRILGRLGLRGKHH